MQYFSSGLMFFNVWVHLFSVLGLWLVYPLRRWSSSPFSSPSVSFVIFSSPPNPAGLIMAYLSEPQVSASLLFSQSTFPPKEVFTSVVWFSGGEVSEGSSNAGTTSSMDAKGFRKHFMSRKLDCDNQAPNPDILFQRCFTANATCVKVESPP